MRFEFEFLGVAPLYIFVFMNAISENNFVKVSNWWFY